MFDVELSEEMLSAGERALFSQWLAEEGLDEAVWDVYDCVMRARTEVTRPTVARVYSGGGLVGAAFAVWCKAYARSLFGHPLLYMPTDWMGLTSFIWIRVGYCAEGMANPGFVAPGCDPDAVFRAALEGFRGAASGLMVIDRADNKALHGHVPRFRYARDGVVDLEPFSAAEDYVATHRNVTRKIKSFVNKGGRIEVIRGPLNEARIRRFEGFLTSTVARSIVYSPFQDCFGAVVSETCARDAGHMVHLVATMRGEDLGYHTFVETGEGLRMVHGAFDRERRTTHHAYENLIIEAVRYGLERGLKTVYFGPVLNETKRRMMSGGDASTLYFHSRSAFVRLWFPAMFPFTRLQSKGMLAFS